MLILFKKKKSYFCYMVVYKLAGYLLCRLKSGK
jgi:hypothetical protein